MPADYSEVLPLMLYTFFGALAGGAMAWLIIIVSEWVLRRFKP